MAGRGEIDGAGAASTGGGSRSVPALLSVSIGVLGAIVALVIAGLSFDVYAQIGLVVLIALAALVFYAGTTRRANAD